MRMAKSVIEVTEGTFEAEVIGRSFEQPVVVDFWAPWCGPCRTLGPMLERLAEEAGGAFRLAKINVDDSPNLSIQFGVQGIPAVKAFREGKVVDEFVGAQPEANVRKFLRRVAPTAADIALNKAASLLATRHWSEAERLYREALATEPANPVAALGLVKALLAQGKGCEAEDLLGDFPPGIEVAQALKLTPLAHFLCEAEDDLPDDVNDVDALYYRGAKIMAKGNFESGMDGLLDVLRENKRYRKGEPRLVMLGVFELLGDDDPVTREYRNGLASVLF